MTKESAAVSELRQQLPSHALITDASLIETYRCDRAMFCDAGVPTAVVRAHSTADVAATLEIAHRHRTPVVAQGARSGLSGGANAIDGCIVVSLEAMDTIVRIDQPNRYVVTQPGVLNADLKRAVAEQDLFYPPDPSSKEFCTIGGNLATNSGGLCCVKYGVTTDYVLGLEVVLASGEVLRTGRTTVKGVAGYDLARLFVGSEGTLGIITEATLRVRSSAGRPQTLAATFARAGDAADAVSRIVNSAVVPSLLEFMDDASVRVVNDRFQLGFDRMVGAVILAQSDAGGPVGASEVEVMASILREAGAIDVVVAESEQEADGLLAARREVITAFESLGTTLIDDVCVPRDRLAELVVGIEKIAAEQRLPIGVFGHAGDGNFHPTVVFDDADADESRRARTAFDDIMMLGLQIGGTITGEHGVGLLKRGPLTAEIGDLSMRVHRDIKAALDPHCILNPGKMF